MIFSVLKFSSMRKCAKCLSVCHGGLHISQSYFFGASFQMHVGDDTSVWRTQQPSSKIHVGTNVVQSVHQCFANYHRSEIHLYRRWLVHWLLTGVLKLVHWPLTGVLLHLVQQGGAWTLPSLILAIPNVTAQPSTPVYQLYAIWCVPNKGLTYTNNLCALTTVARWLSGRASDLRSSSRGFEARPRRCCITTLGKLFTPYCLCHQAV